MRRRGRGRDPLRRRDQRRRRDRAAGRRALPGAVTIDLAALDRVLEVDSVSRAARIQAGVLGPALNAQLAEHGLTLRHFPQSFEYSSLGGWIATRAGGHFATVWTHIDDLVESVRAISPAGDLGEPPAAGLGSGAESRPPVDRLGGDPRPDHRGLGSRPRAPGPQALERGGVRHLRRRIRGGQGARPVGAQPGQLPAPRRGRVGAHARVRGRAGDARARLRIPTPPRRRTHGPGSRADARSRRPGAASGERRAAERPAPTPYQPGATLSSPLPTCATPWSRSASSPRPSRPRSPGIGSRSSTPPSARRPARSSPTSAAPRHAARVRRSCSAGSPTSTRTGRRPTSPSSLRLGAGARWSSGTRSRPRSRRR